MAPGTSLNDEAGCGSAKHAMTLIAILDDRVTNRNIFSRLAATLEEGAEVQAFGDPCEALAALANADPDLVITDFKMPNMDGAEFTRRFRALPHGADIPVIVITVYEDRGFRLRALEAGATDFLQSPVDHQEFITRARNLLKLSKQQRLIKSRALSLESELAASERSRQALLRDSRERLVQVIDTIPAMISATDESGAYIFINAYQAQFSGVDPAQCAGIDPVATFGPAYAARSRALDRLVFEGGEALPAYEEEIIDRSGMPRVFLTTKSPLHDETSTVVGVLTSAIDITERKQAESRLRHIAHHDSLTRLPNRLLLQHRLQRELARDRRGGRLFALHFIDLDRFKEINDAFGHQFGDQLLHAVAGRLSHLTRESDTVARLGGDEFAILQTDLRDSDDAAALARQVVEVLSQPFGIESQTLTLSASIGITIYPRDGSVLDELLRNADLAMYRAKSDGGAGFRFYCADMNQSVREAIRLEADLRQAVAENQFVLHFQPQVNVESGQIIGMEALLRWERPGVGLVKPGEFLSLAEETGLIMPINTWVLREACRQARAWRERGLPPLRLAINLSPVQFRRQNVYELVLQALDDTGIDPHYLELELTETILMENAEASVKTLRALQALGVTFAIDDFGTGYSSLSYVKNFPVDRLKIDQSFVRNLKTDPSDTAIVRAIINLGHSLAIQVVAEGVETREQFTQLAAEGCDEVQGYLFAPPLSAADFEALIVKDRALPHPV